MSSARLAAFTFGMNPPLLDFGEASLPERLGASSAFGAAPFGCGPKQYICMPDDPCICVPSFWHSGFCFELGTNWAYPFAGTRATTTIAAKATRIKGDRTILFFSRIGLPSFGHFVEPSGEYLAFALSSLFLVS